MRQFIAGRKLVYRHCTPRSVGFPGPDSSTLSITFHRVTMKEVADFSA
jgi:hypothetical protein